MSNCKTITFAGHKTYTLYEHAGIGQVLRTRGAQKLRGKIVFSSETETRPVIECGMVVVARVLSGQLQGSWVDVDEHNLRHEFPDAPAQPAPQLDF